MKYWVKLPQSNFNPRKPVPITHNCSSHPLMQLDELEKLAIRFHQSDNNLIKFVPGNTKNASSFKTLTSQPDGKSIQEVFKNISCPGSWIALYDVEKDPVYKKFIHSVIDSISSQINDFDPDVFSSSGYIFISSTPSATPFHIDRENNFFLQIHGKKRFTVWNPDDRNVVSERAIEDKIIRSSLSQVNYDENFISRSEFDNELQPDQGVYMPSTSAHMSNTEAIPSSDDDQYSISIGIVYYTRSTRRSAYIYGMNMLLRHLGLKPKPPYQSRIFDIIRYPFAFIITHILMKYFKIERPEGM